MAAMESDYALLAEYARGVHYAFVEAVRQRDYDRRRAIDAECALREANGRCPEDELCPKILGDVCRACGEDMDKEARYL